MSKAEASKAEVMIHSMSKDGGRVLAIAYIAHGALQGFHNIRHETEIEQGAVQRVAPFLELDAEGLQWLLRTVDEVHVRGVQALLQEQPSECGCREVLLRAIEVMLRQPSNPPWGPGRTAPKRAVSS